MKLKLSGPRTVPAGRALARRLSVMGVAAAGVSVVAAGLATTPGNAAVRPDASSRYSVANLVSDLPGLAQLTDKNLVNPWDVSVAPNGDFWISEQGSGIVTSKGAAPGGLPLLAGLDVSVPGGNPTGVVYNGSDGFLVSDGLKRLPATHIIAGLSGQISGWNVSVGNPDGEDSETAEPAVKVRGASFTGLAIDGGTLYAVDFARGQIDMFNASFHRVIRPGAFADHRVPGAFKPFNVQNLRGHIYVTYARPGRRGSPAANTPGAGFVDVYSPTGKLQKRLISRGQLDSPWGLLIAPTKFGTFSRDLLVGNFGNGRINAYDPATGHFLGPLRNGSGKVIHEDHLWAMTPGNGTAGKRHTVLFTAGIRDGHHGLIGAIALSR